MISMPQGYEPIIGNPIRLLENVILWKYLEVVGTYFSKYNIWVNLAGNVFGNIHNSKKFFRYFSHSVKMQTQGSGKFTWLNGISFRHKD